MLTDFQKKISMPLWKVSEMVEMEQWLSKCEYHWDIVFGGRRAKKFWNLRPKPKTVSELQSRTGEDGGTIFRRSN